MTATSVKLPIQDVLKQTPLTITVKVKGMWRVTIGLALVRLGIKIAGFPKPDVERVK